MQNVVKRLSRLQKDILTFLATVPPPSMETPDEYGRVSLAVLPTTGAVIEAIGRERNPRTMRLFPARLSGWWSEGLSRRGAVSCSLKARAIIIVWRRRLTKPLA